METAVCMQNGLCGNGRCHFLGKLRNRSHYVIITDTTITLLQSCNRHKKSPTQSIVLGKTNCEGLYKDGLDYDQFDLIGQLSPSHHIFYRQLNSNRRPIYLRIQWFYWQQQGRSGIDSSYSGKEAVARYLHPESKKAATTAFIAYYIHQNRINITSANRATTLFAKSKNQPLCWGGGRRICFPSDSIKTTN